MGPHFGGARAVAPFALGQSRPWVKLAGAAVASSTGSGTLEAGTGDGAMRPSDKGRGGARASSRKLAGVSAAPPRSVSTAPRKSAKDEPLNQKPAEIWLEFNESSGGRLSRELNFHNRQHRPVQGRSWAWFYLGCSTFHPKKLKGPAMKNFVQK
jgi:hypothetical protein